MQTESGPVIEVAHRGCREGAKAVALVALKRFRGPRISTDGIAQNGASVILVPVGLAQPIWKVRMGCVPREHESELFSPCHRTYYPEPAGT